MKPETFEDLSEQDQNNIDAWLDGTIEPAAFEQLQDRLMTDASLRRIVRRYQAVNHSLTTLGEIEDVAPTAWLKGEQSTNEGDAQRTPASSSLIPVAMAAGLAFLLGLGLMYFTKSTTTERSSISDIDAHTSATGFAVIGQMFDPVWPDGITRRREGDLLGNEEFKLTAGTAEIQFFSGASMTVEGPARISIASAWEATCFEGAVRMQVPPAARGFKLHAPTTEIIDLGTEFGLVVRGSQSHVEVFDGEIMVKHQDQPAESLKQGAALALPFSGPSKNEPIGSIAFPDGSQFTARSVDQQRAGFDRWQSWRDALATDPRLIAYYTFEREKQGHLIPNIATHGSPETTGTIILAEPVAGRWSGLKESLEFRRPGSRVRVKLPGEFSAFTFMCRVRIDSLDRQYNALFMGDGYETGEPHWQIREDGQMMLSVMVDDSKPHPKWPKNRYHTVYHSPQIWDLSMSGQWLHLASVFDPEKGKVSHYVDGKRISHQEIEPEYMIKTLRIGNAEIGNWGQPFREDPNFGIRNLNGRMDEIAIFKQALSDDEIARLYHQSGTWSDPG